MLAFSTFVNRTLSEIDRLLYFVLILFNGFFALSEIDLGILTP